MDTHPARAWLAKQLRRPVDDALWDALVQTGYTSVQDDDDRGYLLRQAKIIDGYGRSRARQAIREQSVRASGNAGDAEHRDPDDRSPRRMPVQGKLKKAEHERAAALTDYLASVAADHDAVLAFRSQYLNGRLLSAAEARRFI